MKPPDVHIPMHLYIEYGGDHHDDDTVEHEVRFRVVNDTCESHTIAIVQSDFYEHPKVLRYSRVGHFDLPQRVLDQVTVLCFRRLASGMNSLDGNSAHVYMSDARAWLRRRLPKADANLAIAALARHVDPLVTVENLLYVCQD